jgi:hypothetical protein
MASTLQHYAAFFSLRELFLAVIVGVLCIGEKYETESDKCRERV